MSKIELAAQYVEQVCIEDSHGYDQAFRNGNPDFDCSSLQCNAWENAGVPVISKYGCSYTGNMLNFLKCGFVNIASEVDLESGYGLQRGDTLLNVTEGHTAMYLGNNLIGQAISNEFGGIVGGLQGDQTGLEIAITGYRNFYAGWEFVLRYIGETNYYDANRTPKGIGRVFGLDGDVLNVRTGAGINYPFAEWHSLGEGNMVEVCDELNGWYFVRIANQYYGWVYGEYVEYQPLETNHTRVGLVTGVYPYTLNVRTGAGTQYPILASWPALGEENAVEILEENNGWYKIRIAGQHEGYVSAKYLRT